MTFRSVPDEAAKVWFDNLLLPVTPDTLQIKNTNKNESLQSVDGTPITIPKRDPAQTFTLSFFVPIYLDYSFNPYWCYEHTNITQVKTLTDYFWYLKQDREPFVMTIAYPDGSRINGQYLLDDYEYTQDASRGSDYDFSITLTEYYPAQNLELNEGLVNSLVTHGVRNPRRLD